MVEGDDRSVSLAGLTWQRITSLLLGVGMMVASLLTIRHYFLANFPTTIYGGSFCDIGAFFNCDASAYDVLAVIRGVPLGYFGLFLGGLVALGAVLPSAAFERTNKTLLLVNAVGVVGLGVYSTMALGSLCILCAGYWVLSLLAFLLFWRHGLDAGTGFVRSFANPSYRLLGVFGVLGLLGGYGFSLYHEARSDAQMGTGSNIVMEFLELPPVPWPSTISPFWTIRATERFEDAPIRIVEYMDPLCPDCLYLAEQLERLKPEFGDQMNVAFQFFPLEARCNTVVEKDLHPGACDLSYMMAYDPTKFDAIQADIWANFRAARSAEWRLGLAERHGVVAALQDSATQALVHRIIETGREYEKTSERYSHGIRSTPTMIVNNRLIIGTFPDEQMRAIFRALIQEHEAGGRRFLESWTRDG